MTIRIRLLALAVACAWLAGPAWAQVRTSGQVIGTVTDPSGAVVPDVEVQVEDVGTSIMSTTKSNREGGFVFPALQPGRYRLLATASGFQPVIREGLIVETGRATNVVVQFEVAGIAENVSVQAATPMIETTSTIVSNTVSNAQIVKLPLPTRNVLDFSLLVPGTATSGQNRFSSFNGLPGGAINITLDGINNNSARFRSGGTSFFVFAPVRLGAIEEVTVSTSGLTADSGAEGAVQVQFVTRRGTNTFHGQLFDQIRNEAFNANSALNNARRLPKARIRQHEYGGNLGGPIIRGKLFFFGNFEQIYQPGQSTQNRLVLTPEAHQGVFRYLGTDGVQRTVNVLDLARAAGFPGAVDPTIAAQLLEISRTLGTGALGARDLMTNDLSFVIPTKPLNVYPTARVDWQAAPSLAVRGVLNLQYRDLARNPQFPGLDFVNAGFISNYYILATGADWAPRSNLFSQFSFGLQSNREEFNPGNTDAVYGGLGRRINYPTAASLGLPVALNPLYPTNNILPNPRNNPVINALNTTTLLKGSHTLTFGGTIRHTYSWDQSWGGVAGGPAFTLGVAGGDPVSAVFNAIPSLRAADLPRVQTLYAFLTGRISSISGTNNVDEDTHQYGANQVVRREAQTVGGVYAQDSWRVTPRLTMNYGLRWEFSGPMRNTNDIYTSPTFEHILGPSLAPFQPGTFSSVRDPQLAQQSKPYKADLLNPAPNVGIAWTPEPENGILVRLLGKGKSVIRGSVGMNYYDEGLITFLTAAGQNVGLTQSLSLTPGMPGFAPGGLLLSSPIPALVGFPAAFQFPVSQSLFTFAEGFSTIDPNIKTPFVLNWNIGIQREIWKDAAFEVRYVGNRASNLWRTYDLNEVNIVENGFVSEFRNAQRNLQINRSNGVTGFANNNFPGQVPLPTFEAAFGARGSQGALPAASGYTSANFVTWLDEGQAGRLANSLASNSVYLCRMLGNAFGPCGNLGFNVAGPYPINFFQANPYAAGNVARVMTDESHSRYHGLQLQFRQRSRAGLSVTANYTFSKAVTDRYSDSPAVTVNYFTLRDKKRNEGPTPFDLRHAFQSYWTYELPFGRSRAVDIRSPVLNSIVGGWDVSGILRLQSGRAFYLTSDRQTVNQRDAGVVLNGISVKELQARVNVRSGSNGNVYFLDSSLIGPDGRANPQFLASPTTPGQLGDLIYLYGPGLFTVDFGLAKRINTPGGASFNVEVLMLNALNTPNYLVGAAGGFDNGAPVSINSTTFGQTTTVVRDPRNIQIRLHVSF